ncbi:MAG: MarR family transcriptional regulator [Bacteroidia bacterium]|nr:MarR family transcriptional regulator [Bacteroidia bacterium]
MSVSDILSPDSGGTLLERHLYDLNEVYRRHCAYIYAKYKIGPLEMEIIQLIATQGRQRMRDLGTHVGVALSTLTSMVDRIESLKLARRLNARDDRRVVYLELTRKGQSVYQAYCQYIQVTAQLLHRELDTETCQALVQGLDILCHMIPTETTP